ncbi:MAG: DUF4825 domain-containing protein [Lachnospiraceae bacterium]|nr:DUF4825 domain-containing protein [Lachnospiraceae bacterium]
MSKKIPCEVIQDLLPSYIDELTSKASNQMINDHLLECQDCRETLASMQGGLPFAEKAEQDKKEIDFLKKTKRRGRRHIAAGIAGAFLIFAAILAIRAFLVGSSNQTAFAAAGIQVNGKDLQFNAIPLDSASAISGLTYEENDGVVTIKARSVLASPFHTGDLQGTYTASQEISQVRIGDRIIWAEGATVSALASDLYASRHAYIGDMPANNRTALALNLASYLGPFTNELETAEEPYGWKILLSEDIPAAKLPQKERDMDAFGRVITGLIGNLDHVTFVYTSDQQEKTRTITAADASAFLGQDVKDCIQDIRLLDTLIEKTGLSLYAFSNKTAADQEEMWICITNQTDSSVFTTEYTCYESGEACSAGSGQNADNSETKAGEQIWISIASADFAGNWDKDSVVEMSFKFSTKSGETIRIPDKVRLAPTPGAVYNLILTGNKADGYELKQ